MKTEKKLMNKTNDSNERVVRKFGRQHKCTSCQSYTSFLQETFHNVEDDSIRGLYLCKCGYEQGIKITGNFVNWYRETIKSEDITNIRIRQEEEKKAAEEEARLEEEKNMPEVKIG